VLGTADLAEFDDDEEEAHAAPPSDREAWKSLALLLVALVGVVGLAKTISPTIEDGVVSAGLPVSAVGVVIALLVLLPEGLAAVRAARRDRFQTSLNLSYGSAMASIGLTIPTIAFASIWLDGPLALVAVVGNAKLVSPMIERAVAADSLPQSVVGVIIALLSVVGLAKTISPTIEDGLRSAGMPVSAVGVAIALLVLLPEGLAAVRAAGRDKVQTSLNLSYGSAMASIGLTIPAIAVASIWLDGPLTLGLSSLEIALFTVTAAASILTVAPGRATLLQAGVHLALLAAYLVLAVNP